MRRLRLGASLGIIEAFGLAIAGYFLAGCENYCEQLLPIGQGLMIAGLLFFAISVFGLIERRMAPWLVLGHALFLALFILLLLVTLAGSGSGPFVIPALALGAVPLMAIRLVVTGHRLAGA